MVDLDDFIIKDDEVITGISDAPKNIWTSLKIYSQIIAWITFPFIPLYLSQESPFLFYALLSIYIIFFIILNRYIMHYSLLDTCIFILFFLFCVFLIKSFCEYEVIDKESLIYHATTYGNL